MNVKTITLRLDQTVKLHKTHTVVHIKKALKMRAYK